MAVRRSLLRAVTPFALVLASSVASASETPGTPDTAPLTSASSTVSEAAVAARGAAILQPFKSRLMQALQAGLAESPEAAIRACQLQAPALAAAAASGQATAGRSSHRLRNPANAPADWLKPVLDDYLARSEHREPRVQQLPDGRLGYVEPIVMQPLCVTCHGTDVAPAIGATLAERYPDDAATGFAIGDLRGVFWVVMDPAAISAAP